MHTRWAVLIFLTAILAVVSVPLANAASTASATDGANVAPSTYVVEFVATAATGADMNDVGDVTGTSYPDPGCGSSCLPTLDTVVWTGGTRIVLPSVPGFSGITVVGINAQGWVVGFAGIVGTTTHAIVWKPVNNTYVATDLGNLPGKTISTAVGIDDLGRVVGWSTTANFPPVGAPFMWTETGGMVDLSTQGFPLEMPLAISPGGTVATVGFWYRLGDPASVVAMPPPPQGYLTGNESTGINDAGDQARFLISTSSQNLRYLFRFHNDGSWQPISFIGNGNVIYGVGSISAAGDITGTVLSAGVVAYGPDGLAQSLAPLVSPAYGGGALTVVGPMNASGKILTKMIIGQTGQRLVRLVPGQACATNCIKVTNIQMVGKGPAFCDQGNDQVKATVTVTDEAGLPLSGVRITGHFLDDYWLDQVVVGKSNSVGQISFKHIGPPCVGAIAFLVTDAAARPTRTFDKTTGVLTKYVLPLH